MKKKLCVLPALLFCTILSVAQQDTGIITGLVTDASGSPVLGATVSVKNRDTNVGITVSTGSDGIYVATPLKIGAYEIQVEAKGFKKVVRDGVQLQVQDRLRLDFQLQVGDITQTVEVQAAAPLWISPAPASRARATSIRLRQSRERRCCMYSALSSRTTFR